MPEQEELQEPGGARTFWSGTISFGLVSIPVSLLPAQRSVRVSLRMLSPEGTPLKREYFDPETEKSLDPSQIVRGYEVEPDQYVVVTDEELDAIEPQKSRDIDLRLFVERKEIDPAYFDRAYFLVPAGDSTKAYRLLADTMEREDRAGIATFVMRGKEYLIAILAENGILRAETLRFADELRAPAAIGLPEPEQVKATAVKRFETVIRKLQEKSFDPDELHDRAAERLRELIERKQQAGEDVRMASAPAAEPSTDVIDLMEILKRSLAGEGERKEAKRAPAGRRGGKKAGTAGLEDLSREELYERAKQLDIPGRSGMSKQQLVRALQQA